MTRIPGLVLTKGFYADSITEFFLERISALLEDRSVKNNRFISRSYELHEPADGELAWVPIKVNVPLQAPYAF